MDLNNWQSRLDEQFSSLFKQRSIAAPGQPIFALEHGLNTNELADLTEAIRTNIQKQLPSWEHNLAWTVYSAEIGYTYAGDEYWQTFEEKTPGWISHGDRYWIRNCFQHFHERYNGAKPTGPWAERFSIICWPIANAILPCDLQRHLARILYEIGHDISEAALSSPKLIGELIAAQSSNTPSRFQQLTQEPQFIGQIALALLLEGQQSASALIFLSTLDRIGKDLYAVRSARTWMRGARDLLRTRIKFSTRMGARIQVKTEDQVTEELPHVGLEPRLILYPADVSRWDVILQVPDFSVLLSRFPKLREVLLNSSCYIAGTSDRPKGRGWVLFGGGQQVLLKEWPQLEKPIIKFTPSCPELDYLVQTECRLRPGSLWLFKIASDGLAYQVQGARVRAGEKYIVLTDKANPKPEVQDFVQIGLSCRGINAFLLHIPEVISEELSELLAALEISQAGSIKIWPVGLSPSRWDGEGDVEWLSTDNPIIGIRADHDVELFSLRLGSRALEVAPESPGAPVFIELGELDAGNHDLWISAYNDKGEGIVKPEVINIRIRKPQLSLSGASTRQAFFVVIDPSEPTLEQLWEDQIEIDIYGPRHKHLAATLSLYERGQNRSLLSRQLSPLPLPMGVRDWRKQFGILKADRTVQNAYDQAYRCRLDLRADEFGAFILTAEREFSPMRWAIQRMKSEYFLQLRDDSGVERQPQVWFHSFRRPDKGSLISAKEFLYRGGRKAEGGLYIAKTEDYICSVIIPPEVHLLSDLHVEPHLAWYERTPEKISDLVRVLDYWNMARLVGGFSNYSKQIVLEALLNKIHFLICGKDWPEIEKLFKKKNDNDIFQDLWWCIPKEDFKLVDELNKDITQLSLLSPMDRALHLAKVLAQLPATRIDKISLDLQWLVAFALRLASCSKYLAKWANASLLSAISLLIKIPRVLCLSRIMVLMIDNVVRQEQLVSAQLYEGWKWR